MKKLFLLALVAYLAVFASPFVAVAAETVYICEFANAPIKNVYASTEEDKKANYGTYQNAKAAFDQAVAEKLGVAECGTPNDVTLLLEKGDCTEDGQVITEITEVIAPSIPAEEGSALEDSQIITVYAGSCCLAYEENTSDGAIQCIDEVTVYHTDYEECKSATGGAACSRRQWVISDSGLGIVKVMVKQIYTWGAFTVGSIAVMTIILNGVRIQMSGVSGDITEAKNKILQALAGIVLLFLSGVILYTINPEFFS